MSPVPPVSGPDGQPPPSHPAHQAPEEDTDADPVTGAQPPAHPYLSGVVLSLDYTLSGSKTAIPLKAVIRRAFTPFTKSQVLLIDFPDSVQDLPSRAVLKLYDRRYVDDRISEGQPWSTSRERAAIQRWRAVEAGTVPDYDWADERGTAADFDDALWEAYFEEQTHYSYEQETGAYEKLREMQGVHVPRLFGTVRLAFEVDGVSGPHQVIPGLILEYLAGKTLEEQPAPEFVQREPAAVAALLQAVDRFPSLGVIHGDIRPANIVALREPRPRLVLIDFGQAILRWDELSDERWGEIANRDDVADLRLMLSKVRVRDLSPAWPDHALEPLARQQFPNFSTQEQLDRWLVPTETPVGVIRAEERGPWFLLKPGVWEWLTTRDTRDPGYWLMPRPNEPEWTVL